VRRPEEVRRTRLSLIHHRADRMAYPVALAGMVLFALLSVSMLEGRAAAFDSAIMAWMGSLRSPGLTTAMRLLTAMGSALVLMPLALAGALSLIRRRQVPEGMRILISLAGSWVGNEGFKQLLRRPRPPGPWLADASGFGFPSGHAMSATAFYCVAAYVLTDQIANRWRCLAVFLSAVLIVLVAISRVYLGVHYPTDVIAGIAAGGAWAALCTALRIRTGRNWGSTNRRD